MRNLLLVFVGLACLQAFQAQAQNIRTAALDWTATQMSDGSNTINNTSVFKTTPTTIKWVQNRGYIHPFDIISTTGSWTNVGTNGKLTFSISDGEDTGTMIFERTASGIAVYLDLSQGSSPRLVRKFKIDSIQSVN